MSQNVYTAWSEKVEKVLEEEFPNSARNLGRGRVRSEYENVFNHSTSQLNGNDSHISSNDDTFRKRSRNRMSDRLSGNDEIEYETQNLTLQHTPSSETLHSRGSRNFSRHSPPGSYRSLRNATVFTAPQTSRTENAADGINIIMLMGFLIGIGFGAIFNGVEMCLQWFQEKITGLQRRTYKGKSIREFYTQDDSVASKILYSPLSVIFILVQSLVFAVLFTISLFKRPAPPSLVSNILMRYVNE